MTLDSRHSRNAAATFPIALGNIQASGPRRGRRADPGIHPPLIEPSDGKTPARRPSSASDLIAWFDSLMTVCCSKG
jgi:hypothetical protein